jgi:hypothetical protein
MSEEEMRALGVLNTAEVINKFTETVWICVDRHAWDQFVKSTQGVEDVSKRVLSFES